jgi:hypothetical protein
VNESNNRVPYKDTSKVAWDAEYEVVLPIAQMLFDSKVPAGSWYVCIICYMYYMLLCYCIKPYVTPTYRTLLYYYLYPNPIRYTIFFYYIHNTYIHTYILHRDGTCTLLATSDAP